MKEVMHIPGAPVTDMGAPTARWIRSSRWEVGPRLWQYFPSVLYSLPRLDWTAWGRALVISTMVSKRISTLGASVMGSSLIWDKWPVSSCPGLLVDAKYLLTCQAQKPQSGPVSPTEVAQWPPSRNRRTLFSAGRGPAGTGGGGLRRRTAGICSGAGVLP